MKSYLKIIMLACFLVPGFALSAPTVNDGWLTYHFSNIQSSTCGDFDANDPDLNSAIIKYNGKNILLPSDAYEPSGPIAELTELDPLIPIIRNQGDISFEDEGDFYKFHFTVNMNLIQMYIEARDSATGQICKAIMNFSRG